MVKRTILIPIDVEMPDHFTVRFDCTGDEAVVHYSESFPDMPLQEFKVRTEATKQLVKAS